MGTSAAEANGLVAERWLKETSAGRKMEERGEKVRSSHLTGEREFIKKAVSRERKKAVRDSEEFGEALKEKIEDDFLYQWGANWHEWTIEQGCTEHDDTSSDNELEATIRDHRPPGYDPGVPVHVQPGQENRWLSSVEGRWVPEDDPDELDVPQGWFPRKYWCTDDNCTDRIKRAFVIPLTDGSFARLPAPHIHCKECGCAWPAWIRYRPFDLLAWKHEETPEPLCQGCLDNWRKHRDQGK